MYISAILQVLDFFTNKDSLEYFFGLQKKLFGTSQNWEYVKIRQTAENRSTLLEMPFNRYCRIPMLSIRVEWFWKIKSYTFYDVPNCCRTPILKCLVLMLHFHFSLIAEPQKIWSVTLKCTKKLYLFNIFKGWTWNNICSLACLKAKKFSFPL